MMNIVYFVGAGASKALCPDKIPAMNDFFQKAMDSIDGKEDSIGAGAFIELHNVGAYVSKGKESFDVDGLGNPEGLSKFKESHFPARIIANKKLLQAANIEEVFGWLESQTKGIKSYQKLLEMVGWLFWKLDKKCIKEISASNSPYRLLAETIHDSAESGEHQHTFISFNYDIWLEQALFTRDSNLWHPTWGYGFEPMYYLPPENIHINDQTFDGIPAFFMPQKTRNPRGISILKPHGSLSWYHDTSDTYAPIILAATNLREVLFSEGGKILEHVTFPDDKELSPWRTYSPYIVPPTPLKTHSGPIFWEIQKKMEYALANANVVVIIGWSMPDTDQDIRRFIERTIQSRRKQLESVLCCDLKHGDAFYKKYEQIFWPAESPRKCDSGFGGVFIEKYLLPLLDKHRNWI